MVVSDCLRANKHPELSEQREQIVSALNGGVIVLDTDGRIAWMDESTRRRLNGGLKNLVLPTPTSDATAIDCVDSPVDLTIGGERSIVCVVREAGDRNTVRFWCAQ
jgi:hypothetical protein